LYRLDGLNGLLLYCRDSINVWNSLPQNVVKAKTLSDFKKKLDFALGAKGITGYRGRGGIRILNSMIESLQYSTRPFGPSSMYQSQSHLGPILLSFSMNGMLCLYSAQETILFTEYLYM